MKTTQGSFAIDAREPKTYEVHEFIRLKPSGGLIPVGHYRTVYHRDGRISKEALSVQSLVSKMIRAFHGRPQESEGKLMGFFEDPRDAHECAQAIAVYQGKDAQVSGARVTVAI